MVSTSNAPRLKPAAINQANAALANPKQVAQSSVLNVVKEALSAFSIFCETLGGRNPAITPQQYLRLPNADTVVDIKDPNHPAKLGKINPGKAGTRQSSATITFPPDVSARIQKIHILSDNREVVLETLTRKGNKFFFEGNSTTYSKDAIILLEMKDWKSYAARLDEVW